MEVELDNGLNLRAKKLNRDGKGEIYVARQAESSRQSNDCHEFSPEFFTQSAVT
jgi:hypothetical protein